MNAISDRRVRRDPGFVVGAALVGVTVATVALSYVWTPFDPLEIDPELSLTGPAWPHVLGTDENGRDILSNVIVGARSTFGVAVGAVVIGMLVGTLIGLLVGTASARTRGAATFAIDIVLALPSVLLAIVLAAVYEPSTLTAIVAIGIALAAAVSRIVARDTRAVLTNDFVLAARACGANRRRIIRVHVLPNVRSSLFVHASGAAAVAILAESTLSYIGLGTRPPTPSWGRMLATSQQFLIVEPLHALWPGIAIVVAVLGFNLLGDGLRERLDPTLRGAA
jgi:peptide/nickel transport system permease protein